MSPVSHRPWSPRRRLLATVATVLLGAVLPGAAQAQTATTEGEPKAADPVNTTAVDVDDAHFPAPAASEPPAEAPASASSAPAEGDGESEAEAEASGAATDGTASEGDGVEPAPPPPPAQKPVEKPVEKPVQKAAKKPGPPPVDATDADLDGAELEGSDDGVAATPTGSRLGDPVPLTRREPTLKAMSLMGGLRYGLVGTGPTRFSNDVRFAFTDNFEIRTSLLPWPAALTARYRLGSQQGELGAFLIEGGLAYFDAGVRLAEDSGEPKVGVRFHPEIDIGYAKALGDRYAIHAYAHYRARVSFLDNDDQHALAVDAHFTTDLLPNLAVSGGLGFASTIGTPVREVVVNFVETDRPGMSHLLARDDGHEQSLTVPLTLTYGRVDSFDVDLFCTPRVYPEFGIIFGAGIRFRLEPLFDD